MVNAIIEISDNGVSKGNVELKVHNPSLTKKKGATLELRKMSGFDYENVEIVKTMITTILDGVIAGAEVTEVLKNLSNNVPLKNVAGKVTSKPKLFSCCICSFQTRFATALKAHTTRIHNQTPVKSQNQFKCDICVFIGETSASLDDHMKTHRVCNKRSKDFFKCAIINCDSTFDTEDKLSEHEHNQHPSQIKLIYFRGFLNLHLLLLRERRLRLKTKMILK